MLCLCSTQKSSALTGFPARNSGKNVFEIHSVYSLLKRARSSRSLAEGFGFYATGIFNLFFTKFINFLILSSKVGPDRAILMLLSLGQLFGINHLPLRSVNGYLAFGCCLTERALFLKLLK